MGKCVTSKIYFFFMALLLSCALLSGCGDGTETSQKTKQPGTEETIDWKTEGFAVSGKVEENQKLWVKEYIPWTHDKVVVDHKTEILYPFSITSSRAYGDKIYQLYTVFVLSDPNYQAARWILEIYDTKTMSSSVRELSFEQLGENPSQNNYILKAMDLPAEDSYVFQWVEIEKNSEDQSRQSANRMIYLDPQGDLYKVELLETYREKGVIKDTFESQVLIPDCCVCDSAGNTYHKARMSRYGYTQLYVMDREGTVLLEYIGTSDQAIEDPMRVGNGELIYPVYDAAEHSYFFFWPDLETGEMRLLCTFNGIRDLKQRIKRLYGMQGNIVYYEVYDGIVAWDIQNGTRTLVLSYRENGISDKYDTMLIFKEGQPPLLRLSWKSSEDGDEDWLALLSEEPVQREDAIRVAALVSDSVGSKQVSECCALVSRKDMNQTILYQKAGLDADAFRTKIMTELMAGNGPDILYVSRTDMARLKELGLLADLRELVPQETLEDLWPGAVSMGTIDGMLAGLPLCITEAKTLAVSRDTWDEDTWLLEDITSLMDEGRLYTSVYYPRNENYFGTWFLGCEMAQSMLADSFLIDWEKRESHFEDQRYVHFLELVEQYCAKYWAGEEKELLSDHPGSWFHGGKSIAYITFTYHKEAENFGVMEDREGAHYVGYPTKEGSGSYLNTSGMLVVNANIKDKEKIEMFLEYALGNKIQRICDTLPFCADPAFSVRRFHTEEIEQTTEGEYLWRGVKLSVMEDGTTSLHRAISFLESCVPMPEFDPNIIKIVDEELSIYRDPNNDRSVQQTAEIIDRRVQIYLDEDN